MNNLNLRSAPNVFTVGIFVLLFIAVFFTSCKPEIETWKVSSDKQVATDYINTKPEFSEFAKLVEVTGLSPLLGIRGPYTIMLPTNDAMLAYYKEKGVSSSADLDATFRRKLVLNHLVLNEISSGDMGLGAIRDTNAIGDYLVTEFQGADILLNKHSIIIDRDVKLANGFAHVIDRVIEPVTKDIFTVIAEDPSFKIFAEGLRLTGINDTLEHITFTYGKKTPRTRFTVLAVPDTIFQRYGINSVSDLVKWTGGSNDSLTSLNDPFYRYIEYHCLVGTHYLSSLNSQLYPVLSFDNNVLMTIDSDYKINVSPETKKYTTFIVEASNALAKNGTMHAINDLLPITEMAPQSVIFETTDFLEFKQGDFYGKYYMKWNDGQNDFEKIKFGGDFLGYYYKNHDIPQPLINYDAIFMLGYWWCEITFPKVMKGHYQIIYGSPWSTTANFSIYIDGKLSRFTYDGQKGGNQLVAEEVFTTTSEHSVKVVALNPDDLYWDFVQFKPVL